ncbi:hypothetical protein QCA50_005740 [Cerrena zonata]|uniref:Major facilitator superfamily (MFS) profile domain-containing protein n=1 Tax=Cerrena zonata TaxID=2478898 RepID=A0AAW0GCJ4_9APHY
MSFNGHLGQARYRPGSIPSTNQGERLGYTDLRTPEPAILQQHQYYDDRDSLQSFTPTDNLNRIRVDGLNEVDEAVFSRFHARVCFIAGVGFFTDAYDIFAINIASTMIGYVYGPEHGLSIRQDLGLKIATQVGTLFGQLVFGVLADRYGRRRMYGIEMVVMVFATLAQALSGAAPAMGIIGALIVWRFVMGVAIGGDYPLSAVIASEFAPVYARGRLMAAVFSNQGLGQLAAAVTALIVTTTAMKTSTTVSMDVAWRILIGVGCIPGAIAIGMRHTIPESPRFIMDVSRNVEQASRVIDRYLKTGTYDAEDVKYHNPNQRVQAPTATFANFRAYFSQKKNLIPLLAVCYSWFIIDFAYYGLALNSSTILQSIQFSPNVKKASSPQEALSSLQKISEGNLILIGAGLLPGYILAILFIDRLGRKTIQYTGFAALFIIFMIMGWGYDRFASGLETAGANTNITPGIKAYVFFYCLAYFFQNFGPNTTTFIIPGEMFPTRYRTTAHGIAAATGKLGAIVVQVVLELKVFDSSTDLQSVRKPVRLMFILFGFIMLSGLVSTYFTPETKERTLEEISNEPQEKFISGPPVEEELELARLAGERSRTL